MDFVEKAKLSILLKEGDSLLSKGNLADAIKRYTEAVPALQKAGEKEKVAHYLRRIGECYTKMEHHRVEEKLADYQRAEEYYVQAGEMYAQLGKMQVAGECFEDAAQSYEKLGKFQNVASLYARSAVMFVSSNDIYSATSAFNLAAQYFEKAGDMQAAADTYLKAAVMNSKANEPSTARLNYLKAATAFDQLRQWSPAVDAYASAASIDLEIRNYDEVADTYDHMAEDYGKLNKLEDALYYHEEAAKIRFSNHEYEKAAESYFASAALEKERGIYDRALFYYKEAAKIFMEAHSTKKVGECYLHMAEVMSSQSKPVEAASYFMDAAKQFDIAKERNSAIVAYKDAVKTYLVASRKLISEHNLDEAALMLKAAAEGYVELKDFPVAALTYNEYGEVLFAQKKTAESNAAFILSANTYIKAELFGDAADSFVKAGAHEKAGEYFVKNAEIQEKKGVLVEAGDSYRKAARCYNQLKDEVRRSQSYEKAISAYEHYTNKNRKLEGKSDGELRVFGNAANHAGECEWDVSDVRKAKEFFEKAIEAFELIKEKTEVQIELGRSKAMLKKADAVILIERGEYPGAGEMLEESKKIMENVIAEINASRAYKEYLTEHKKDIERTLRKIELKPDVVVITDGRAYTFPNMLVVVNIRIKNESQYTIQKISFLSNVPEQIKLNNLPSQIQKLESGNQIRLYMEITPLQKGEYRIKPVEVFYEDNDGNKYVKASNEMTLEVEERPQSDFKNYRIAVETFLKYARTNEANGNLYFAAEGYREAAETYGKFNKDDVLDAYYQKAIDTFVSFYNEAKDEREDPIKVKRLGDALRSTAECCRGLGDHQKAREFFKQALDLYQSARVSDSITLTQAFVYKEDATIQIDHGDYESAKQSLNQSLSLFQETIIHGGWVLDYIKYLEKNVDEIRLQLEKMKARPDVSLTVEEPLPAKAGDKISLTVQVSNPGTEPIKSLKFIPQLPSSFQVIQMPSALPELRPGERRTITFAVSSEKQGTYPLKPLNMTYEDSKKSSYILGSNEVTFAITTGTQPQQAAAQPHAPLAIAQKAEPDGEVEFAVTQPAALVANQTTAIKGSVKNLRKGIITGVRFIAVTPSQIRVDGTPPEIKEMQPDSTAEIELTITPLETGEYTFVPLEMFYHDQHGDRYFKASNEIQTTITNPEKEEKKEEIKHAGPTMPPLEDGVTYLAKEDHMAISIKAFISEVERKHTPLLITRQNPKRIKDDYGLKEEEIMWLTDVGEGRRIIHPNIEDVSLLIEKFIEKNPQGVVLLEGLEYLITANEFPPILNLIQHLRDTVSTTQARLIFLVNPQVLDPTQVKGLERECRILEQKPK
ncbi:Soluble NSF attachment protein, SNAP [uncultured archaeon]|nr:Soluble NSF attachment protein, SNAP [uncultured archaeon]